MEATPKNNISPERAIDLLNEGLALKDAYINGELKIETNETWDRTVVIENCIIEYFSGSVTKFVKHVKLTNCHFKRCQFVFTYFLGGLTIDNCTFENYLDFQAGGHNKKGNAVTIINSTFNDFVNFFDCCYESEITISNNKFHKGTNLLGMPFNIPVTFESEPTIKDNLGQIDIDNEGERS